MKELTKAEEEIMHVMWEMGEGTVKSFIRMLPEPKPAYNTVSTIVRILEQKSFVGHHEQGKSFIYFPLITKEAYSKRFLKSVVTRFFSGSYQQMVSFFTQQNDMSLDELEEVLEELKNKQDD